MELISENRKIRKRPRQVSRLDGSQKKQKESSTTAICGNEFLRYGFSPVKSEVYPGLQDTGKVESEFFNSLTNLTDFYKLELADYSGLTYPQNILTAFNDVSAAMEIVNGELKLAIVQDDDHIATLATAKPFNTESTFYYLAVCPLNNLLSDKKRKETSNLMLSVFAYLLQINKVSYYTERGSYIGDMYERLQDNADEDYDYEMQNGQVEEEDQQFYDHSTEHFRFISNAGNTVLNLIQQKVHLSEFKMRLNAYAPVTDAENSLKKTAVMAHSLYSKFPNRSIMDNIRTAFFITNEEDYRTINVENYLSFFWSYDDCIFDQLWDWVNCEFEDADAIDEPLGFQFFNTPQRQQHHELEFETQFFELIHHLSDTLNQFSHE